MATQPVSTPVSPLERSYTSSVQAIFSTDPSISDGRKLAAAHTLLDAIEHKLETADRARAQLLRAFQTGKLFGRPLHRYSALCRTGRRPHANDNAASANAHKGPPAERLKKLAAIRADSQRIRATMQSKSGKQK